jgi:tetratricopeptide (TPR) repeat protein
MDPFRKRWETKTTAELKQELERRQADSKQQSEVLSRAEKDPNYRGGDLPERWQELAEDGMIIGDLRNTILERQMREVRARQQQAIPNSVHLPPEQIQELLSQGITYIHKFDYRQALEVFNKILDDERDAWEAYYYRGWALASLNQREIADEDFGTVIQMKPDYIDAYIKRAELWDYDSKRGIPAYTELVRVDPHNAHAHYKLGWLLYMSKSYDEAIACSSQAIHLNPALEYAYHTRLCCRFEIGAYEQALADCELSIQLFSNRSSMQYHIDRIQKKMAESSS